MKDGSAAAAEKVRLRKELRRERARRGTARHDFVAEALAAAWPALCEWAGDPQSVAGYQPTTAEPDPRGLLAAARADGKTILLPRTHANNQLEWVEATDLHLAERPEQLPSPEGHGVGVGAEPLLEHSAVVLVPALAVDPDTGFRLGQGGGYYDRFLAELRRLGLTGAAATTPVDLVTVVFADELIPVPADPHDEPVDAVLTEAGLITVSLSPP